METLALFIAYIALWVALVSIWDARATRSLSEKENTHD